MPDKKSILLIHPPLAKPGEPPAGIARLAGFLKRGGVDCRIYDANLEGISDLLGSRLANPFMDRFMYPIIRQTPGRNGR